MARKPIKKNLEQTPEGTLAVVDEKLEILIRKIRPVKTPVRNGACWDLFLPEDVEVRPGQIIKIPLGIAIKLPPGWHVKMFVRSSTPLKWGLIEPHSVGIVDNGYSGDEDELIFLAYRPTDLKDKPVAIPAGTRLVQIAIEQDAPACEFKEVDHLPDPSRGGFGSTGA